MGIQGGIAVWLRALPRVVPAHFQVTIHENISSADGYAHQFRFKGDLRAHMYFIALFSFQFPLTYGFGVIEFC